MGRKWFAGQRQEQWTAAPNWRWEGRRGRATRGRRKVGNALTGLAWPTARRAAATIDAVFMMICVIQVSLAEDGVQLQVQTILPGSGRAS